MEAHEAEVIKFTTTRDGAFRVTLDFSSSNKLLGHFLSDKAVDNKTLKMVFLDDAVSLEVGEK